MEDGHRCPKRLKRQRTPLSLDVVRLRRRLDDQSSFANGALGDPRVGQNRRANASRRLRFHGQDVLRASSRVDRDEHGDFAGQRQAGRLHGGSGKLLRLEGLMDFARESRHALVQRCAGRRPLVDDGEAGNLDHHAEEQRRCQQVHRVADSRNEDDGGSNEHGAAGYRRPQTWKGGSQALAIARAEEAFQAPRQDVDTRCRNEDGPRNRALTHVRRSPLLAQRPSEQRGPASRRR